jgi:hypothetical protein
VKTHLKAGINKGDIAEIKNIFARRCGCRDQPKS